ncbi:MAG: hypothetical protein PHV34_01725 [Verrucomicrobiae bacterium]|nr:hypothetical protein [Verrucomicrobiae bacterium]
MTRFLPLPARWLLLAFVAAVRVAGNWLFFRLFGPYSSAGADIWYFAGVAGGDERLFPLDPLSWLLWLGRGWPVETLFWGVLALGIVLHLAAVWLFFGLVREIYRDEWAALWAAAAFGCVSTGFLLCTGNFVHQLEAMPVMLLVMRTGVRWLREKTADGRRRFAWMLTGLILLGLCMGPDTAFLLAAAVPAVVLWRFRDAAPAWRRWMIAGGVVVVAVGVWFSAREVAGALVGNLAMKMRGIDLAAQQRLQVGDLAPLSWGHLVSTYPWMIYLMGVAVFAACWRGRVVEICFLVMGALLAFTAVRFVFLLEWAWLVVFGWFLARVAPSFRARQWMGGAVVAGLLLAAAGRGFECHCPSIILRALAAARQAPQQALVWCNPSYGFVVKSWTGAEPTANIQRLEHNPEWMALAALPSEKAIRELKKKRVTHLLLTSHDYEERWVRGGDGRMQVEVRCSGGLQDPLSTLGPEAVKDTLVCQALAATLPLPGMTLLFAGSDRNTGLKVVFYRVDGDSTFGENKD